MKHHRVLTILVVTAALWPVHLIARAGDEIDKLLGRLGSEPFDEGVLAALEGQPDDGRVMSALRSAFASSEIKREKQWIASTLLRLGEPSTQAYLDFLIDGAKDAIEDRAPIALAYDEKGQMIRGRFSDQFEAWCKANGKDPRSVGALQFGTYPVDVLLLARAQQPGAKAALRRALESPNSLVASYAVQGLGRLGDTSAIPLIAKAAQALPASDRSVIAMNLPWFSTSEAFALMEQLVPDPSARHMMLLMVQGLQDVERRNAMLRQGGQSRK